LSASVILSSSRIKALLAGVRAGEAVAGLVAPSTAGDVGEEEEEEDEGEASEAKAGATANKSEAAEITTLKKRILLEPLI
jgi:hypothetical protein